MGIKKRSNFPVGECISDCFLKKIEYKEGERDDGTEWEAAVFYISKGGDWVSIFISKYVKDPLHTKDKAEEERYRREVALERILALFLDTQEMKEDYRNNLPRIKKRTFKNWFKLMKWAIEKRDYKSVNLSVKTLPNDKGEAYIPMIGKFIKKTSDRDTVLQYSTWEREKIENYGKRR